MRQSWPVDDVLITSGICALRTRWNFLRVELLDASEQVEGTAATLHDDPKGLISEMFGPALIASYESEAELVAVPSVLDGQLTASVTGSETDVVAGTLGATLTPPRLAASSGTSGPSVS
jgi:hypothetical protein